jgi:hypothetical protein
MLKRSMYGRVICGIAICGGLLLAVSPSFAQTLGGGDDGGEDGGTSDGCGDAGDSCVVVTLAQFCAFEQKVDPNYDPLLCDDTPGVGDDNWTPQTWPTSSTECSDEVAGSSCNGEDAGCGEDAGTQAAPDATVATTPDASFGMPTVDATTATATPL